MHAGNSNFLLFGKKIKTHSNPLMLSCFVCFLIQIRYKTLHSHNTILGVLTGQARKKWEEERRETKDMPSFIHLLCARQWEFKDEQDKVPILEELTKIVPIFEDPLKIKTMVANVVLGTEFLSLNKIEHSQLCLDRPSAINGPKQVPILSYNDGAAVGAA